MLTEQQQRLVVDHLSLARRLAVQLQRQTGAFISVDDLTSEAVLGMMEAARRFDPARGVRFNTYAAPRMVGRMRDWLREWDHLSRDDRRQVTAGRRRDVQLLPLHAKVYTSDRGDVPLLSLLVDRKAPPADDRQQRLELFSLLRRCLSRTHRLLILLYYAEGLKLHEIAEALGKTESWASVELRRAESYVREMIENNPRHMEAAGIA